MALVCLATISICSCRKSNEQQEGTLRISLKNTKSLPNEEEFFLSVVNSSGKSIYNGLFKDSPEEFIVPSGSYTISAYSCEFEYPDYDCPQYGDSQVVVVAPNQTINVSLFCQQINSGIKFTIDKSLKDTFPNAQLELSGSGGELIYEYSEKRTAFFLPGKMTCNLRDGDGKNHTLFTRNLYAQEILTIKLSSSISKPSGGISIQVDTTRTHIMEEISYPDNNSGSMSDALDIESAKEHIAEKDVWITGYIVGCAAGSSTYQFEAPFTKNTNLIIGLRSSSRDKDYLLCVELKTGDIRDNLNLEYNPNLLGKKIYLKGDIVSSYFGLIGLKNVSEYQF